MDDFYNDSKDENSMRGFSWKPYLLTAFVAIGLIFGAATLSNAQSAPECPYTMEMHISGNSPDFDVIARIDTQAAVDDLFKILENILGPVPPFLKGVNNVVVFERKAGGYALAYAIDECYAGWSPLEDEQFKTVFGKGV